MHHIRHVLGPLGQSITAANQLGSTTQQTLPAPYTAGLQAFGLIYELPVWGFAVLWAALAAALTFRTSRTHLPFSLTWWSFTFPVGTLVTGTSALALHTGATLFTLASNTFYVSLILAWLVVAGRTLHGSIRGDLFALAPADNGAPARTRRLRKSDPPGRQAIPAD
jgi:tellurite resistance protein TehA-like permease